MKLKNNSRGFTLIELLITVAIMLSILIISITSITGVDKRKKEEAYKQVVNTIETAAEQFVSSNEYFFEDNSTSKVPLKELIAKGYISNVIDPRDGTKINQCTYVNVKKTNGKIKVEKFKSTPDINECDLSVVSGTPDEEYEDYVPAKIITTFVCDGKSVNAPKGWFNKAILAECGGKLSVNVDITKDQRDESVGLEINGEETDISSCDGKSSCTITDNQSFNTDTIGKRVIYKIRYKGSQERKSVKEAKIDTVAPDVPTVGLYKFAKNSDSPVSKKGLADYDTGSWSNLKVFTEAKSSDKTSGIAGYKFTTTGTTTNQTGASGSWRRIMANGKSTIKYMACDKAENCSDYSAVQNVMIDTVAPTVTVSLTSDDGKSSKSIKSGSHAHYKNMKYKITASDEKKNNSKSGIKEIRYIVENGLKTNKKFKDYKNKILSGTENSLLDFAGKKTVYAVAIDNAGNRGYAYAVGILDNDAVAVNHEKQQCNFTLSFSLRYAHTDKQIADGFQYAVWNVESTSDETNEQSGDVANRCGSAPPDNATFNKVSGNESKQIRILTKNRSKAYYCFAVRPLKVDSKYVPKYDDLKWTVQRKHAMSNSCQ